MFDLFRLTTPQLQHGFLADSFLGTVFRVAYDSTRVVRGAAQTLPPAVDNEYFEWIDLLTAVADASGSFTFLELGAGYGRWSIRAAAAAQQLGIESVTLACVEAEPSHFAWLRQTLTDNGLDPDAHILRRAAMAGEPGRVLFSASSGGDCAQFAPESWYGQGVIRISDGSAGQRALSMMRRTLGRLMRRDPVMLIPVVALTLGDLLEPLEHVDLIDLDLQGSELEVLLSSIVDLTKKVRRLHVGTHSTEIEAGLRKTLSGFGWHCAADYGCGTTNDTPYGRVTFQDGVQSWLNPRLPEPEAREDTVAGA